MSNFPWIYITCLVLYWWHSGGVLLSECIHFSWRAVKMRLSQAAAQCIWPWVTRCFPKQLKVLFTAAFSSHDNLVVTLSLSQVHSTCQTTSNNLLYVMLKCCNVTWQEHLFFLAVWPNSSFVINILNRTTFILST